jgi:hypothetical protein
MDPRCPPEGAYSTGTEWALGSEDADAAGYVPGSANEVAGVLQMGRTDRAYVLAGALVGIDP